MQIMGDQDLFPARITRKTISNTTATAIKIPTPMPALKMPAMASHELSRQSMESSRNDNWNLKFFMLFLLVADPKIWFGKSCWYKRATAA
jgi:hypothetical protein